MSTTATTAPLLVLWDQDCSFCSRAAAYASEHFVVEATPYQWVDVTAYGLTPEQCGEALQVVDRRTGRVFAGSDAVAQVMRTRHGAWAVLGRVGGSAVVRPIAQPAYRLVARNRHRLPGGTAACALPPRTREPGKTD
jgi:predicted DCC family thiol-disulfide oxidoreductase YuxK